jgi:uncharacterized membrane protein HdeD (DUF308 family)
MAIVLVRNWWALLIRGLLALIFGVLCFVLPGDALTALVLLFGAYALVNGVIAVFGALKAPRRYKRWWAPMLGGVFSIIAGLLALLWPGITALALLYLIAFWAIITGGFEIGTAIRLRKEIKGEWILALSGIISVLFGAVLLFYPIAGALTVVWLIGAYAIVYGVLIIALSLRLWSLEAQKSVVPITATSSERNSRSK